MAAYQGGEKVSTIWLHTREETRRKDSSEGNNCPAGRGGKVEKGRGRGGRCRKGGGEGKGEGRGGGEEEETP